MILARNPRFRRLLQEVEDLMSQADLEAADKSIAQLYHAVIDFSVRVHSTEFQIACNFIDEGWFCIPSATGSLTLACYNGHVYHLKRNEGFDRYVFSREANTPQLDLTSDLRRIDVLEHLLNLTEEREISVPAVPIEAPEKLACPYCETEIWKPHERWHLANAHPDKVLQRLLRGGDHKEARLFALDKGLTLPT